MSFIPFKEASYLSQVRRSRTLALEALERYKIGHVKELKFINHGENTTFKVLTSSTNYLLRIHRANYHTPGALKEELRWLEALNKDSQFNVQKPIKNLNSKLTTLIAHPLMGGDRHCDLLEWQNGKMKVNFLRIEDLRKIGELTAFLHEKGSEFQNKSRDYWDAEGLIGKNAKFGSLYEMEDFWRSDFNSIRAAQKLLLKKLNLFEKKHPDNLIMIHADLHLGNLIWRQGSVSPIDFDDCGTGSRLYDIAVSLFSIERVLLKSTKKERLAMINSYLKGYIKQKSLSSKEIEMIPYYMLSRDLVMLCWLFNRRDNPALRKYLNKIKKAKLKKIKVFLNEGISGVDELGLLKL